MAMAMPSLDIMFWKRALHKYVHIYTHLFICGKLFSKHNNQTWHCHCNPICLMALTTFLLEKSSSCSYEVFYIFHMSQLNSFGELSLFDLDSFFF